MKNLFLCSLCLVVLLGFVAYNVRGEIGAVDPVMLSSDKKDEKPKSICPETLRAKECMTCHREIDFKLKEIPLGHGLNLPYGASVMELNGKMIITAEVNNIAASQFERLFRYLTWHPEFKYLRFEVDSYGGGMWAMKSIVGYMDEFKASGGIIETVVRAKAFSAGFVIFLNGTKGYRFVSPTAHLMWHQVATFDMFKFNDPATSEDESKLLRHWQDTQDEWIAERSKLTKEEISAMVHKKELWCNGKEAVEKYGFADKLI
jgi:ATP-dependent protease ClpP protease subunit